MDINSRRAHRNDDDDDDEPTSLRQMMRSNAIYIYLTLIPVYIVVFHSSVFTRLFQPTGSQVVKRPWDYHKPPPMMNAPLPYARPNPSSRKFTSKAVEKLIDEVSSELRDRNLARLFENILPSTLDTTVYWHDDFEAFPRSYIVTGDINAMWLRDSMNQVMPYIPLAKEDSELRALLLGLLYVQAEYVSEFPYANAFLPPVDSPIERKLNRDAMKDKVRPRPDYKVIWEAKYELDSLAAFLKLSRKLHAAGITEFVNKTLWVAAVRSAIHVMEVQQLGSEQDQHHRDAYRFERQSTRSTETLMMEGRGEAVRKCGLIKSHFRPSDDASTFPFLVPANAMASVELDRVSRILKEDDLASRAKRLSDQVREAIWEYAVVPWRNPDTGKWERIFAYEVDGYGSHHIMDDANIPSLLSLPYLEFVDVKDETYQRTRKVLLSEHNKYYFHGKAGWGIGGPHVGYGWIWPMSNAMTILTSTDDEEIKASLDLLTESTAGTGLIHGKYSDMNFLPLTL